MQLSEEHRRYELGLSSILDGGGKGSAFIFMIIITSDICWYKVLFCLQFFIIQAGKSCLKKDTFKSNKEKENKSVGPLVENELPLEWRPGRND